LIYIFQESYYEEEGINIYNDIPLHDLIGTVSSQSPEVEEFCSLDDETRLQPQREDDLDGSESLNKRSERWELASLQPQQQQQQQQQQQLYRSLVVVNGGSKKSKSSSESEVKSPSYLTSATARRAEEMLSSLGESMELMTSPTPPTTTTTTTSSKEEIVLTSPVKTEGRKRKRVPEYDVEEVSNVLAEVSKELNDIFSQMGGPQKTVRPGYPLSSMFGLSSPTKMIRLEFDAKDSSSSDDKSNHNASERVEKTLLTSSSPSSDSKEITRQAASVNDTREGKQREEEDYEESSNCIKEKVSCDTRDGKVSISSTLNVRKFVRTSHFGSFF